MMKKLKNPPDEYKDAYDAVSDLYDAYMKVDLINDLGISSSTIAKMTKGEKVSMNILEKICDELDCDFGDIIHYEKNKDGGNNEL